MAAPSSIQKVELSGSTDGRPIKVVATATAGTTIHTAAATTGVNNYDEIWLWACNTSATIAKLTLEWGGTTSPDDTIEVYIPAESGLVLVSPGLILQNELIVKAFADAANVVIIAGYVNRMAA